MPYDDIDRLLDTASKHLTNPDSRRVDLPNQQVDLPGRYSINIDNGALTVYGCDCCEDIETIDKAHEVIALIEAWIDAPERS